MKVDNTKKEVNINPLAAIVCGFTGGGTTLLTDILRQHPKLDSGFEGGLLLAEKVSDFLSIQPYCKNVQKHWQISEDEMKFICDANSWHQSYKRLRDISPVITNKNVLLFDKTPRYMTCLSEVLSKVPDVLCIACVRDPRAVFWTQTKRTYKKARQEYGENLTVQEWAKHRLEDGCKNYIRFGQGYKKAIESGFEKQILLIRHELLCVSKELESKKMFDFLQLSFDSKFLTFQDTTNQYFPSRGNNISSQYIYEYKKNLSQDICDEILIKTKEFEAWFWEK